MSDFQPYKKGDVVAIIDTRRLVGVSKSSSWSRRDRNEYFLVAS